VDCVNVRTLLWQGDLNWSWSPRNKWSKLSLSYSLKRFMHLSGIHIALDNVQDAYEVSFLDSSWNHDVLSLEESTHNIKNCCLSNSRCILRNSERSVSCHEEVTSRGWNQWANQTYHVIVHVSWIPQSCRRCSHDCRNNGIDLLKCWMQKFQSVDSYSVQSLVIEHNDRVSIQSKSL